MTVHSSPDMDELSAHSAEDQHPPPPVEPTPAYTPRPTAVEQTVVRGPPTAAELTSSVLYNAKRFSVSFGGQPNGRTTAQGPEYSKGAKVRGTVRVGEKYMDRVGSVELKIIGTIKLSIHDSGSTNTTFLDHTIRLHPSQPGPSFAPPCPSALSFKWPLPQTYVDTWGQPPTKRTRPLPPTYELTIVDVPGMRARVRYEVVVVVRWKWKGLVGRKESLSTPFTYVPYAPHPHHAHASVISTLKSCPGEWASFTERVPTRSPEVGEIMSSLVLPTPPLHPLSQAIPFHFQLSAECPPPTRRGRRLSISSGTSKLSASKPITTTTTTTTNPAAPKQPNIPIALLAEPAVLRLQIQRQISVDVRGARALRVICGGVGRMERVVLGSRRSGCEVVYEGQVSGPGPSSSSGSNGAPPAYTSLRRTNSLRSVLSAGTTGGASIMGPLPPGVERVKDYEGGKDWFAIAWEGSVTPEKDVLQVGGFRAGGLLIKDFVTLTLVPPTPELSPLRALQQAVPIRCILVSEAEMQAAMSGGW
ncbi:hypothetical protein RSOLAG1IB_05915 [Rhizoctonia solani AG-1 IB]|uniref:Uncharacterized protein n=1 Tax=Thanatephorus cucumeris (strain AG1-IB / isolate 7/3/14) TaxID=1108050 RepID=A0A0B7F734_THACB|nr:hypothetical protein RSOLAG1IB_05915 [Rhizoctonia solani AG-1 IB]